ncbi:MAG TPA: DUF4249 domain-containing protein [Chryseosolibacter sp.]
MRTVYIFLLSVVVFASCDEPIDLDVNQVEPKIVIEGSVTDKPGYQMVKVSRSVGFYTDGTTPKITNASVTVSDDLGETVTFTHNPGNHPDSAGIYLPPASFVGKIGRTYTLRVTADGQDFEATDKLLPVISMDSLKYQVSESQEEDPNEEGKIYELLMYAREPQNEKNFYLFKFYRNDSLTFFNETDIYYSDDELLSENINGATSPVYYGKDDVAVVEVYSMSRTGYVYYNDLFSILNGDSGGMFGPVPAQPRTNINNGAIGFFQVSAIDISTVKIE